MATALERLNTLSRYVTIVLKFLMVMFILMILAMIAITILSATGAEVMDGAFDRTPADIYVLTSAVIVSGAFGLAIVYMLNRVFTNIHRMHSPFLDDNARYLKIISLLVLMSAIAIPVVEFSMSYALNLSGGYSEFNVGMVFMAFLIYLVSLIFKYGTALQKESDETL